MFKEFARSLPIEFVQCRDQTGRRHPKGSYTETALLSAIKSQGKIAGAIACAGDGYLVYWELAGSAESDSIEELKACLDWSQVFMSHIGPVGELAGYENHGRRFSEYAVPAALGVKPRVFAVSRMRK